jgi:hypothetical protein
VRGLERSPGPAIEDAAEPVARSRPERGFKPRWVLHVLAAVIAAALAAACSSTSGEDPRSRMMVVDTLGVPVQGAFLILVPENENPSARPATYTKAELKAQTSDAQGMIRADLDDCLWESDHSYHFRIRARGFEDLEMTVSRDLFPPLLRVEMRRLGQEPVRR